MLRYDKRSGKMMRLMVSMGMAILIILGFCCLDGDPGWEVFIYAGGFMFVWFAVLVLFFIIPMVRMNKRCKKVDKFGHDLYGVIVGARRNSHFIEGKRGFTWLYGFDIVVFDGEKTTTLTLSFQEWIEGLDAKKCYSYVNELTKHDGKTINDFNSIFYDNSPLFIKGKKYNSDVLFKKSIPFEEVPFEFVEALREYCIKTYDCMNK